MLESIVRARQKVAETKGVGFDLEKWLAWQIRLGGVQENAAVIAIIEGSELKDEVVAQYLARHPERRQLVGDLLETL